MNTLFFLTLLLLFGVGLVFAQTDRQDVMAHWDTKRCNMSVILASNLYKPTDDPRSGSEFAKENLKFCADRIIKQVMEAAMSPFLAVAKSQMDLMKPIQAVMTSVKGMMAKFFRTFSRIFDGVYQRFLGVAFNFRKTFVLFMTAMNRAFAIATSSIYAGLSVVVTIQNFYDAVIKIVMIVLGVLMGIVILLFLAFFPVIPIILTTIAVLVAGGVAAAGDMKGTFCFSPETEIQTMRGTVPIRNLTLGEKLSDGGIVEGILQVNGSSATIYKLKGICVSGDHLVFYQPLKKWILVKEHPEARKEVKQEPILICLNTSTREIPIAGLRFRDWEEIPPQNMEIQKEWNKLVAEMLGTESFLATDDYALLSGIWFVQTPDGPVALRDVQIGMKVLDADKKWTKVLGIYEGYEYVREGSDSYWHTDSIWWKTSGSWEQRYQKGGQKKSYTSRGFHLVTDSGTFRIQNMETEEAVRDFTEVGSDRIDETYEWMKARI